MRSLPNIFKPSQTVNQAGSVLLPDLPPPKPQVISPVDESKLSPQQMYDRMVEKARKDSADFTAAMVSRAHIEAQEIVVEARRQAEQIKEEAWKQAFAQALEQRDLELYTLITETDKVLNGTRITLDTFLTRFESELRVFALSIAEKVIARQLREDDLLLVQMVKDAVETVRQEGRVVISVCEGLPGLVVQLKKELSAKQYEGRIEVRGKDVPLDCCIIETPDGQVDASVSEQLKNLRELLLDE